VTRKATVYKTVSSNRTRYYGCLRSTGRTTHLATVRAGQTDLQSLTLRGHYTAFIAGYSSVDAVNLSNGKHIVRDQGYGNSEKVVVGRTGRLAWTIFYEDQSVAWSSFTTTAIQYADGDYCTGCNGIEPYSLRLTGRHHDREISWLHGGETKYFVIP